MVRGTTIPKGRVNLPREAKPKREDKILVFADGKLAKDAKDAGADIVGGIELIEGVRSLFANSHNLFHDLAVDHKRETPSYNYSVYTVPHTCYHAQAWSCTRS